MRAIRQGIWSPIALATASDGTVFVANSPGSNENTVTAYAPGGTQLIRTISLGFHRPAGLEIGSGS